tara:strand:+ start:8890 stop:9771 length:882 start_codon:yes stop_codon:yes gene_type:complete
MRDSQELTKLPEVKQKELRKLVNAIHQKTTKSQPVEMIILFGSYARGEGVEDRYVEDHITYEYQSDFDILVLVRFKNRKRQTRLEWTLIKAIEESGIETPVTVIVHDVDYVNEALSNSQYFFVDIYEQGICLYDSKRYVLGKPVSLAPEKRYQFAKEDFDYWLEKADSCLRVHLLCYNANEFNKAVFELHQCAENLYHTVLLVYTHYKPKCHDLKKLRGLICGLDDRFINSYPMETELDRLLFDILCNSYIDARYKRDYVVVSSDMEEIGTRVKAFRDEVERLCQDKVNSFIK